VQAFGYALTKLDGGHLRGALPSSATLSCITIVAHYDNEENAK